MISFFKKIINKQAIVFIVFFLVNFLILLFSNYKDGGDDVFYRNASENYSLKEFLIFRYNRWTGRIVSETLSYLFNGSLAEIWPLINAGMATLLAILIFKSVGIFSNLKSNKKIFLAVAICLSFLLIETKTRSAAIVWRTGSANYLWPVTLGLLAFYPFLKSLKNKLDKKYLWIYVAISLVAAMAMEQVSAVLIMGTIAYFGWMIKNKKKIEPVFYLMGLNFIIGSLILFLAPGNKIRFGQEMAHNFPGFTDLSVFNRVSISLYWVVNKLVNVMPLVLALIYLVLGLKTKKKIGKLAVAIGLILIIKSILGIELKIYPITSDNFIFINILLTYFGVFLGLFLIPLLIWQNYKLSNKTLIYGLILLTVIILMVMITLSPTLDVSGNRTVFLPNVILIVLGLLLVN